MCIVIDTNALAPVFNTDCDDHAEFAPVRAWILDGKGFLVYGGTRYKRELKRAWRYLKFVRTLKDAHKAYEVDEARIDKREVEIADLTQNTDCDDQHIIAIISVSGCKLVCSMDARADDFVKDPRLYPRDRPRRLRPRIYRSSRNANLLCDRSIVALRHVV